MKRHSIIVYVDLPDGCRFKGPLARPKAFLPNLIEAQLKFSVIAQSDADRSQVKATYLNETETPPNA